ncbi:MULTISPECIES: NAD(P)/FAD-dependent oxidoreductase [Ralstonia solanacearum species complex]|uniref:FAD-dependent oxidoreductase n=5 Tax=Ralstonia solanacearum species complex TaxID=3116862 RepID=A0A0S4UPN9_RALSL|nr:MULTISPECIES: FAD-dependent oxidoreductase [Ralstonia]MCF1442510.1 FAD-dependent oxidoreductase [Ralstonia solanacearum]MBX9429479.1 FAD-dependent oxidoreductase [Ralstonia pseudosolanacearum]QWQ11562.1 FAD-dependent oxidoreductase [Ralstonia solanacearum]UZF14410.1 FAD-dependent oxidoreductase [Ralstonia solanacearum]UZF24510.1 FAD-dependent oxidoreductase [Ralstonia sp. RS642]
MHSDTAAPAGRRAITVVGAGIVGVSCALQLQRDGHRVTLLDQAGIGEGCSYGNAGCLSVASVVAMALPGMLAQVPKWLADPLGPLTVRWSYLPRALPWLLKWIRAGTEARARAVARPLADLFSATYPGYRGLLEPAQYDDLIRATGHLYVWRTLARGPGEVLAHSIRDATGVRSQALSAGEVRELEPALAGDIRSGLLLPDNGFTCNPERLVKTLAAHFVAAGGTVLRRKVLDFALGERGPTRLYTDCGSLPVSTLVICAGAWSMRLGARLTGVRIPLDTERGYHAMLRAPTVQPSRPVMDCERKFIATPMEDGLRIAGTVEIGGLDIPPDFRRADTLTRHGQALFPGLAFTGDSAWMGYRPSIPDSLPVIDRSERFPDVFFAFGHGHLGMTGAPGTGRLIADLVAGRPPFIDARPYGLQRFD